MKHFTLLLFALSLPAQTLTPRQLFYKEDPEAKPAPKPAAKPAPKKSAPKASAKPATSEVATPTPQIPQVQSATYTPERPLGLRYALVKLDSNGAETEVSPTAPFRSGDKIRLKVEGNRDGYLYVISRGSSGNWQPLFPAADINGGDNKIAPRKTYRLPSATQVFTFDEQAGQEQLFVIYSADPVKDIDALIPSLAGPPKTERPEILSARAKSIDDTLVSRLRNSYSRDLLVQTVTPNQPAPAAAVAAEPTMPESAVYIVDKTGARLVADIRLDHR